MLHWHMQQQPTLSLRRTCGDQMLLLLLAQVDAALAPFYIRLQLLENLGLYSMPDGEEGGEGGKGWRQDSCRGADVASRPGSGGCFAVLLECRYSQFVP
jgi:hypothetical protein